MCLLSNLKYYGNRSDESCDSSGTEVIVFFKF